MRNEKFNEFEEISRVLKHPSNGIWESGGPILYYHNNVPYYYDKEGHVLYIGRSGMGKTFYGIENHIGSLINARESFILPITKGDMLKKMRGLLPNDYVVRTVDFRHLTTSPGFHPLIYAYRLYKSGISENIQLALEILEEIAFGLYPDKRSSDPFWEDSARTLFISLAELLFSHAESEDEVNLYNLYRMVMQGDEKFGGSNFLKEWVNYEPETAVARMNLQSYVNAPTETKGGIRCVYFRGLSPYIRSEAMVNMLSNDDFKMEELDGETPTAIFIVLPDETPIYNAVCGMLLSQLTRHFIKLAENKYNGTLPTKMHIVIDELASVSCSIPNLDYLMAASRSRGVRITGVLQSLSQLEDVYGKSKAETIVANFGVIIAFSTNNFDTLQDLSRRCGERRNRAGQVEPLITPVQIGAMGIGQALIIIENRYRYITNLPNFNEVFGNATDFNSYNEIKVQRKPIKVFDIQEKVKNQKKQTLLGNSDERKSIPSFFNPFESMESPSTSDTSEQAPEVDVDALLKKIDAKIAELEEEERLEKEKTSKLDGCMVSIMNKGNNLPALVSLVAKTLEITLKEAKGVCEELPFDIKITSRQKANEFLKQAEKLGVIAIIKSNN